ncbi:hypothetical protein [Aurantibacillus circumpalustris]|uniref:hypothetical protein n=1 Tax=Aurantibacillus circumpalustris TaxID=3036359 RepID=UPI00295BCA31|nr:hypothetical protein [Aurantibacillus circumpalustris]
MKLIQISLFLVLIFSFCRNEDLTRDMNAYFEKEISKRREILDTLKVNNDSLRVNTKTVHEEVNNFILMSKDIENLSASVNTANAYFLNLAHAYRINESDFTNVAVTMHTNEIAVILKQNELNFFNQLIFKSNILQYSLFTAQ